MLFELKYWVYYGKNEFGLRLSFWVVFERKRKSLEREFAFGSSWILRGGKERLFFTKNNIHCEFWRVWNYTSWVRVFLGASSPFLEVLWRVFVEANILGGISSKLKIFLVR